MKWGWLLLALPLMGASPIYNDYGSQESIYGEMRNIYDSLQGKQFSQYSSTPNLTDMQDGEIAVYMSTPTPAVTALILRSGTTLYVSPNFTRIIGR